MDVTSKNAENKTEKPQYHYHVEDGQFSFDFNETRLLGKEGEVVKTFTDRSDEEEDIYILFIDGFYVECIGNIDRDFPENKEQHEALKNWMIEAYEKD